MMIPHLFVIYMVITKPNIVHYLLITLVPQKKGSAVKNYLFQIYHYHHSIFLRSAWIETCDPINLFFKLAVALRASAWIETENTEIKF